MATRPSTYRTPFPVPASTLVSRSGRGTGTKHIRSLPAAASSGAALGCAAAHIHLSAHYRAQFGEHLKLAGSCGELGGWDLDKAKSMQWTDGDYWVADLCLPAQEPINFKLVHVATDGQHWEPGDNKVLEVPSEEQMLSIHDLHVAWGCPNVESAPADVEVAITDEVDPTVAQTGATDSSAKPVDSAALPLTEEGHSVSMTPASLASVFMPAAAANEKEAPVHINSDGACPSLAI